MKNKCTRREMLSTGISAAAGLGLMSCGVRPGIESFKPAAKRPNILFIMSDQLRWDCLSCEGHPLVKTPNLDRLAREGIRFANSYSVAPVCCPSRRSAFTGRYAHVHGVTMNSLPADDGEVLITSILKHYGYTTAISGKLHHLPKEFDYDFDYFWSFKDEGPHKLETWPEYLINKYGAAGKKTIKPGTNRWGKTRVGRWIGEFAFPKEDFRSFWITDRSIDFLRSRSDTSKPWFLFTSYQIPHPPYIAPEPYWSMYDADTMKLPTVPEEINAKDKEMYGKRKGNLPDEEIMKMLTAQYFGHIRNLDDNIGQLLGELDRLGMAEDTIVLFTADHGDLLGEHGMRGKGVMYEGSSHIPLLMRAPANASYAAEFNKGQVIEEIIENTDLLPTILEMAGLPVPDNGIQGESFLDLALNRDRNWKNRCFSERIGAMLRTPGFKLISANNNGDGPYELYDMRSDPKEEHDLADDENYKTLVAGMAQKIKEWHNDNPAPVTIPGMPMPEYAVLDPEIRESLVEKGSRVSARDEED